MTTRALAALHVASLARKKAAHYQSIGMHHVAAAEMARAHAAMRVARMAGNAHQNEEMKGRGFDAHA